MQLVEWLDDITPGQNRRYGGKVSSLAELKRISLEPNSGFLTADGFGISVASFDAHLRASGLHKAIRNIFQGIDPDDDSDVNKRATEARLSIATSLMPQNVKDTILDFYKVLARRTLAKMAVRSSALTEDQADASSAGQQDTVLNVVGEDAMIKAVLQVWASVYNTEAVSYRFSNNQGGMAGIGVGIQEMIQAEVSGVMFTANTQKGERNQCVIEAVRGLGELEVSGEADPDEYVVDKATYADIKVSILPQLQMLTENPDPNGTPSIMTDVPPDLVNEPKLTQEQRVRLTRVGSKIEIAYGQPMDIEWAIVGDVIYVLQARPITIDIDSNAGLRPEASMDDETQPLLRQANGVSNGVGCGNVCIVYTRDDIPKMRDGDVLVMRMTFPWAEPAMKKASAIITERGGRLCHAAIISQEKKIPCVLGYKNATQILRPGQLVTVDGAYGKVFDGRSEIRLAWGELYKQDRIRIRKEMAQLKTKTKVGAIIGEVETAETAAEIADEVSLLRLEFLLKEWGIHPGLNLMEGTENAYVQFLVDGLSRVCRAFGDRPVKVRTTDFKSDEYDGIDGAEHFVETEDNPMMGERGPLLYTNFPEIFELEIRAMLEVRKTYKNLEVMIPFVRTVSQLQDTLDLMERFGMVRGVDGLKVGMMVEVPSNVILLKQFLPFLDFISWGTNDLTQAVLMSDRNNEKLNAICDETDPAVKALIELGVMLKNEYEAETGRKIVMSLCGNAANDHPSYAAYLVDLGFDGFGASEDEIPVIRKRVYTHELQNN